MEYTEPYLQYGNGYFNTPVFFPDGLESGIQDIPKKKIYKTYVKLSQGDWLKMRWYQLLSLICMDDGKIRLIRDKEEYDKERQDKYNHKKEKYAFLVENYLTERTVKRIINKFAYKNGYTWYRVSEQDDDLADYIFKKIEYIMKHQIKENEKKSEK